VSTGFSNPAFRRSFPSNLSPPLRRQLVSASRAALAAERLGALVLARVTEILLNLARQNLGDADRIGDAVSAGRFWPCGPFGIDSAPC